MTPTSPSRRRRWLSQAAVLIAVVLFLGESGLGLALLALGWPRSQNVTGIGGSPVLGYLAMGTAFAACGFALALRRPDNYLGWLYIGGGLLLVLQMTLPEYAFAIYQLGRDLPLRQVAAGLANWYWSLIALYLYLASALVFPSGRLLTPRWRWAALVVLLCLVVNTVAFGLAPGYATPGVGAPNPLGVRAGWERALLNVAVLPTLIVPAIVAVAALVVHWRRGSALERLQIRWPVSISALTLVLFFATWPLPSGWELTIVNDVLVLSFMAVPASVLVAISRYRLYDLDRLISRTLAYASVTVLLGGVYAAAVTVATRVLPFSTPLGVAAATLLAAALFSPLRRRAQRVVDRRFNRSRYDSEATVAAFSARLRAEVELESVRTDLLSTVAQATQPSRISIWLRSPGG